MIKDCIPLEVIYQWVDYSFSSYAIYNNFVIGIGQDSDIVRSLKRRPWYMFIYTIKLIIYSFYPV